VTLTLPVVAPWGTEVVILVAVAAETVAVVVPIFTVFFEGVVLKLVPEITNTVPTGPELGVNPLMVGAFATGVDGLSSLLHEITRPKAKRAKNNNFFCFIFLKFKGLKPQFPKTRADFLVRSDGCCFWVDVGRFWLMDGMGYSVILLLEVGSRESGVGSRKSPARRRWGSREFELVLLVDGFMFHVSCL
jgi:hypothetical protein